MKTIGFIGGSTWVSTTVYYRTINQLTQQMLGGTYSASILMYSLKFHEFSKLVQEGRMEEVEALLISIAQNLEKGGADCLMIGANTPHMFATSIQHKIGIPLIHIGDATAKEIQNKGLKKIGLLGTKPTMELDFYKTKLKEYGIENLIPEEDDRSYIHDTIFHEFSREIFTNEAKKRYLDIVTGLEKRGAEGVILGCTEIPMLIQQNDCSIPVFDTMYIHSKAAVEFANGMNN